MKPVRLARRSLPPLLVYAVVAGLSVELSRINHGFAMFWIANGLVVPWLLARPPRQWWPLLAGIAAVGGAITATIGLGWRVAPLLGLASGTEAAIAAGLIRAIYRRWRTYTSVTAVLAIYLAGGLVAPALSAVPAALAMTVATGVDFAGALQQWIGAHGLGFVAVFPCVGLLGLARAQHRRIVSPGQGRSVALSLAAVLTAGLICFGQSQVPLLFLPILVTMYTMVLTDLFVSALGLTILLAMAEASAFVGIGPLQLVAHSPEERFLFLQFYTACVSLTAMPVALMLEQRRKVLAALAESDTRFRMLAEFSTDIIMITSLDGKISFVSPSVQQIGGWDPAELVGKSKRELIAPGHQAAVREAHNAALARPGTTAMVEYIGTREARSRWFEAHLRAIVRDDGGIEGVCSIVRDVSHRKRREAELHAVALTDPLTNVANRRAFDLFMRDPGTSLEEGYVALFDLDHFKRINDSFGHEAGDRVLKAFARAARSAVRESDLVARIGGEEFAVHLHDTTLPRAKLVCERICAALVREVERSVPEAGRVTASVGISRFDGPIAAVLKRADAALYAAKAAGRDRLQIAA